jgi:DNA-binding MarR family transcriptional regulator
MSQRKTKLSASASVPGNGEPVIDASFLESLLGYNARRTALIIIEAFLDRMSVYGLRPVDFSTLSLVAHNPGITSRQLCAALAILPPNLVRIVADLDKRGLLQRKPHPTDGRAIGLHLSTEGRKMMREAEATVLALEDAASSRLTVDERLTLISLLKKVYKA